MKKHYKYMHTINGKPGHFDGAQITYAIQTRAIPLVDSLKELRRQSLASIRYRSKHEWPVPSYDYMKVQVP